MIRVCKKCGEEKDILFFVKKKKQNGTNYYLYTCKLCSIDYAKNYCKFYYQKHKNILIKNSQEWYQNNIDKKKQYDSKYIKDNKASKKEYDIKYRKNNKDKIYKRTNIYVKNRKINDSSYKLRKSISYSIWYYLNLNCSSKNNKSILQYLSYSMKDLKEHLEKQFEPWMTWQNYGAYHIRLWNDNDRSTWTWNIDHIIPQSKLLYKTMEEDNFKKCWALDNLRPYSSKQNIIDSNKR